MSQGRQKLTDSEVIELRKAYADGADARILADMYGVCRGTVYNLCAGRRRPSAGGPITKGRFKKSPSHGAGRPRALSDEAVKEVRERYNSEDKQVTQAELADEYGVSTGVISCAINEKGVYSREGEAR